jgi:hypothetical protein
MQDLDFIVIGAQKSATTTLFELLKGHPEICMPMEKEVPFFTGDRADTADWPQFVETYFGSARQGQRLGKISPQYMCDPNVPGRIHALSPNSKLIAILRDPVERCWSQYQMGRRRNTEDRSFSSAIEDLLSEESLIMGRSEAPPSHDNGYESEGEFYVAWSEYGRQLARFREFFEPDQLLVLYTEDLERTPQYVVDSVLSFIGLEPEYRPGNLNTHAHKGSGKALIPRNIRDRLRNNPLFSCLWGLVPSQTQGKIRFKYDQWNVSRNDNREGPSIATQIALRNHFAEDLKTLRQYAQLPPTWLSRYNIQ